MATKSARQIGLELRRQAELVEQEAKRLRKASDAILGAKNYKAKGKRKAKPVDPTHDVDNINPAPEQNPEGEVAITSSSNQADIVNLSQDNPTPEPTQ